ncbi:hypothetical protein L6164_012895 [Bauhinia variegata]|uniref:Uncharacterized protein n=1 Tax=Bauhinia variegata TaxID=167791 RepID=A0ACB9PBU0_BAUVA|nr:hypothetical protein L6164_012895 [Bauhinia variegata]
MSDIVTIKGSSNSTQGMKLSTKTFNENLFSGDGWYGKFLWALVLSPSTEAWIVWPEQHKIKFGSRIKGLIQRMLGYLVRGFDACMIGRVEAESHSHSEGTIRRA